MSYDTIESSVQDGRPVEIYDFVIGSTAYHFITSSDAQTVDGTAYTPLPISREQIVIGSEDRSNLISVTMPASHPFALGYSTRVPGQRAHLTIRRLHRGDSELITLFKGVVRSVSFSDKQGVARVGVMPISGALARAVPRYTYQSLCNNVLFDSWCTMAQADYKFTGAIGTIVRSTLFDVTGLNAGKGAGWAIGGFAVYDLDYRLIIGQNTDQIKLLLPFNEALTGDIDVYAGCDHTLNTCLGKFDNAINYGGFPFVPTRNPFQTGIK